MVKHFGLYRMQFVQEDKGKRLVEIRFDDSRPIRVGQQVRMKCAAMSMLLARMGYGNSREYNTEAMVQSLHQPFMAMRDERVVEALVKVHDKWVRARFKVTEVLGLHRTKSDAELIRVISARPTTPEWERTHEAPYAHRGNA